ncbi:MAG: hypothetical protein ATN35_10995 [Epulopiscium sp. Nele67-Bin004]|nr:MAG: hypothetical protein ATN35_10995 [Epulopiscium sp. Nele67-Bin004]
MLQNLERQHIGKEFSYNIKVEITTKFSPVVKELLQQSQQQDIDFIFTILVINVLDIFVKDKNHINAKYLLEIKNIISIKDMLPMNHMNTLEFLMPVHIPQAPQQFASRVIQPPTMQQFDDDEPGVFVPLEVKRLSVY